MNLKIRVILDAKKDVFRDIQISGKQNLLSFHRIVKEAFDLEGEEMASFYLSNENWFQGSEIPLENIFDEEGGETMAKIQLNEVMGQVGRRMIYVYDFFNMWTFFCETIECDEKEAATAVVYSYGKMPDKAPVKDTMDFFIEENEDEISPKRDDIFDDDDFNEYY
ncbi:Plasmid pRiA4b ORF-3-like protein [Candidatus Ornithobacterium hominis]|uniref:Plasmid pRiA4b ORF-3-like protein n=1 Tax=Candidatus Ornithobacterium hominis TaxID=2497989 RepID=A0A383U431_9FLAO|nr:hypothetical protein [Candidatus Ornithobacterium hominis]MCT7904612.1 plasmid pRiA4b ORF-3 family protein [Candidatus Ornithobacterium hominis]SZD74046.1 Plasmid pRiA4b ORF-3-like protein [Candidatus Ornithobacterium hominis]